MSSPFGYHIGPTGRKALKLLRRAGLATTTAVFASVVEDLYIRVYDRRHGVCTNGYIPLAQTSLGRNGVECKRGHRYRAVNAWAFEGLLAAPAPSKGLSFVDLGCGLGRACLIAAKYGFRRIKGVDMVPEFCAQARTNVEAFCRSSSNCPPIEILLEDAVEYSGRSDDDIIFLYNPFPPDVLERVIDNLIESARRQQRSFLIIYSERVLETSHTLEVLRKQESLKQVFSHSSWGQSFHVFCLSSK